MGWHMFLIKCSLAKLDVKGVCGAGVEVVGMETRKSTSIWRISVIFKLVQKVELVLEYGLKAGSCIQGVGVCCLGHSSADLCMRGESKGGCGNSAE